MSPVPPAAPRSAAPTPPAATPPLPARRPAAGPPDTAHPSFPLPSPGRLDRPDTAHPSFPLPGGLGRPAADRPAADRPAADRPAADRPAPGRPAPVRTPRHSAPVPPLPGWSPPGEPGPPAPAPAPAATGSHALHLSGLRRSGARRAPLSPRRKRLVHALVALGCIVTVVAGYYLGLYLYADRAIDRVDALVTDGPEVLAPQLQAAGSTYLVVGTGLPGRSGAAAVSTVVAHVAGNGRHAVMVSVPPTALTDTPACRTADGSVRQPVTEQFADALLDGGPSCLVRSVQQLSGLRVDHLVQLDLGKAPGLVDALGSVPVCPTGGRTLSAGQVTGYLDPDTATEDVTGAAAGDRVQRVLTATLRGALTAGTLADPVTLTRFLTRAGGALTVDADTTLGDVRSLAATLGDLPDDAVQRTAVPVAQVGYVPAGSDTAAVLLDGTATRELFDSVIDGGQLPPAAEAPAEGEQDGGAQPSEAADSSSSGRAGAGDTLPDPTLAEAVPPGTTVTVPPAGVRVEVLDATGGGRAAEVADGLKAGGFTVTAQGAEPGAVQRTIVRYGPASLEPARTVAAAVPGSVLVESDHVGNDVQLVVGPGFQGLTGVGVGAPVPESAAPPAPADAAACS
ncbi:LytR C-terminal domain-containing protein [Modestobacter sp. NPDC049651]|uniref:LytR C-terminal domain-containing protein n=1 Tax=unclassified Modestobacter TaxID=2643866 RepID=UPI0033CF7F20